MRSIPALFSILLAGSALAPPLGWAQQGGRSLHWPEITVEAHLDAEGRLRIREQQAILFNGAWNGGERGFDVRPGQRLEIHGVSRVEPGAGDEIELEDGDLDEVGRYQRLEDDILRWRARSSDDPPFDQDVLVFVIDYTLSPVLEPLGDSEYRLAHDFLFSDRAGVVESFQVDLTWDPVWEAPSDDGSLTESATGLGPGRGYVVTTTFRYDGEGVPGAVAQPAPAWSRGLALGAALATPLLILIGLRSRKAELDADAPMPTHDAVDEGWLQRNLFHLRPEVAGAAWDHSVGAPEVAALLARLVAEGKLESRVDGDSSSPVLHLTRMADLDAFEPHERKLLDGLFFDGGRATDTDAIREHYKKSGFDPAERIRDALLEEIDSLPGQGKVDRPWWRGILIVTGGALLATVGARGTGGWQLGLAATVLLVTLGGVAAGFAAMLSRRVVNRLGPAVGIVSVLTLGSLFLVLLGAGVIETGPFLRAGPAVLTGASIMLLGSVWLAYRLLAPTETAERRAYRRKVAAAREFFERELKRPEPDLRDEWFPYLLAFGLGSHVDRWFREFGGQLSSGHAPVVVPTGGRSGSSGWTGGGPKFGGGGGFGGGGAGGAWGVAAVGMAAGVSPPSSSGSGGGGSSVSGGGSGGWW